jgi:signal peptidase I
VDDVQTRGNGLATASLILGIISVIAFLFPIFALLATVFGAVGLAVAGRLGGKGKTRAGWGLGLGIVSLVLFALVVISLRVFYVPSQAMAPTLNVGDRVVYNRLAYLIGHPHFADVVLFENPNLTEDGASDLYIKRVIGLPGQTVEIRSGTVFIDGARISEPYLSGPGLRDRSDYPPTEVRPNHLFVLGDNRPISLDSRGVLGQIPLDRVVGKAFVLLWPASRLEWLSDT